MSDGAGFIAAHRHALGMPETPPNAVLIDLMVAAILMALGMMMVPPVSISLPLKVMLFVLIDGWSLLVRALAGAYA